MIKEYAYYITIGRFTQILEEIEKSIKDYADSFGQNKKGDKKLREKARLLCEEHLEKSGLRTPGNTYINIDTEFFENTELQEEKLNHFIKEVLKAHAFQKILWEYMGTTGLMTDISKECLKKEGKSYENLLPAALREKERQKQAKRLKFDFNKLKDNSGFDWSKGYDPNSTVEKNGWYGSYDKDGVWTYYKTDGEENLRTQKDKKVSKIIIVKNERGAMLYDTEEILLNPIILWYLTHRNEVYGELESDTLRIIQDIKEQMDTLGVEKITEVVCTDIHSKKKTSEYKKILGTLADSKLKLKDKETSLKILEKVKEHEQKEIVEHKNKDLQTKIDAIVRVKPNVKTEEIVKILEEGSVSIPLNIQNKQDAITAGFTDSEYKLYIELEETLSKAQKESFNKAVTNLITSLNSYYFTEVTKESYIKKIYEYIKNNQNVKISYEAGLKDVLLKENTEKKIIKEEFKELIKNILPQENQETALRYVDNLPEQKKENLAKVYNALYNAIKNYLDIRSSTGLSIKELFDYSVKQTDGILFKEAYVPVTGYISSVNKESAPTNKDYDKYRIYFETEISKIYDELSAFSIPEKEVLLSDLETQYKEENKTKQIIKISNKKADEDFKMVYDSNTANTITPVILAILKKLKAKGGKTESEKVSAIAKQSKTAQEFLSALKKDYQIEYDLSDKKIQELYSEQNSAQITIKLLSGYQEEYTEEAEKLTNQEDYKYKGKAEIKPSYKEVELKEDSLPTGLKTVTEYSSDWKEKDSLQVLQQRKVSEPKPSHSDKAQNNNLIPEEKTEVIHLMNSMSNAEREEFLHSTGDDSSIISPLLIKEYLWRKKHGQSLNNLTREVRLFEKFRNLSITDLQSLKNAFNLLESQEKHVESYKSPTGDVLYRSAVSSDNTQEVLSSSLTPELQSTLSENTKEHQVITPEVKTSLSSSVYSPQVLPPKIQTALKNSYGIDITSISPVEQEYVQNLIQKKTQESYEGLHNIVPSVKIKSPSNPEYNEGHKYERTGITPELKEAIQNLRKTYKNSTLPTAKHVPQADTPEAINDPMYRYNQNYEHDRAVLAKTDPDFLANNSFWNVGHAGVEEELSRREMNYLKKQKLEEIIEKVKDIGV